MAKGVRCGRGLIVDRQGMFKSWMVVVTNGKRKEKEDRSIRSPIQSNRSFPHAGEPRKLAIALYSYSHFSP